MTNYKTMADRIRKCKTDDELKKCERSLTNLYNAGIFTENEFARLDGVIVDTYAKIEGIL